MTAAEEPPEFAAASQPHRLDYGVVHPARSRSGWLPELAVFALAGALRLATIGAQGGTGKGFGYDESVYYAAADALLHGRVPYRDFHLLHPPLSTLLLTPFAWLGSVTKDSTGYIVANLAGLVVGALCAALVVRIGRRLGYPTVATVVAGLFYAIAPAATLAEHSARLEPLGNLALLLALLAVATPGPLTRRRGILCGLALGAAVSIKIWYAAPAVVVLAWLLARRSRRAAGGFAVLGAAITGALVDLPFVLLAPSRMFHMVVTAQFGRPERAVTPEYRLGALTGVELLRADHHEAAAVLSGLAVVAVVGALYVARRSPLGALFAALAAVQIAVVVASPSWFPYYDDYPVPSIALTLGAAWAGAGAARSRPALLRQACVVVPTLCAAVVTAGWFVSGQYRGTVNYPIGRVREALAGYRCLVADDPEAQIYLDRLSQDLARGCPDWVDVSGTSYWPNPYPYGTAARSRFWVAKQVRYFQSGDASLLVRTLPSPPAALLRALAHNGMILRGPEYVAYRSPAPEFRSPRSGSGGVRRGSATS